MAIRGTPRITHADLKVSVGDKVNTMSICAPIESNGREGETIREDALHHVQSCTMPCPDWGRTSTILGSVVLQGRLHVMRLERVLDAGDGCDGLFDGTGRLW